MAGVVAGVEASPLEPLMEVVEVEVAAEAVIRPAQPAAEECSMVAVGPKPTRRCVNSYSAYIMAHGDAGRASAGVRQSAASTSRSTQPWNRWPPPSLRPKRKSGFAPVFTFRWMPRPVA